jgi:hypothetical protein
MLIKTIINSNWINCIFCYWNRLYLPIIIFINIINYLKQDTFKLLLLWKKLIKYIVNYIKNIYYDFYHMIWNINQLKKEIIKSIIGRIVFSIKKLLIYVKRLIL